MINVLLNLSKKPSFLNQLILISLPEQISFCPIFSRRHFENQISDTNKSHGPLKISICMIMYQRSYLNQVLQTVNYCLNERRLM